jgi:hypothetical protein
MLVDQNKRKQSIGVSHRGKKMVSPWYLLKQFLYDKFDINCIIGNSAPIYGRKLGI